MLSLSSTWTRRLSLLSVPLSAVAAVGVWTLAPLDPRPAAMLAITALCIVLWIGNVIPPSYTGLIGVGLIGVVFSPELAFVGFQKPAAWLVAFGLIMGEATRRSGLAEWAGHRITDLSTAESPAENPLGTYRRLLVGLSAGGLVLALFVPATVVRVLVLAPLLIEVGERFDSRRARLGLFLGPLFATYYGGIGILTAAVPNIIITGILESVAGQTISWTQWFGTMFPVMSLGRVALVVAIAYLLYRPDGDLSVRDVEQEAASMTGDERRMLGFLLVGVVFWATDLVHGLHPVYGALVVVLLAFVPGYGVVEFSEVTGDVDFSILFFLAAVFAIGEGMSETGLADTLAQQFFGVIPADASLAVVLALVFAITLPLMLLMGGLAVASVITPIMISFGVDAGLPLVPMIMTESIALGTYFFPYQSAVLVAILAYDVIDAPELIRMTVWCSIATIAILLPIQLGIFSILF